MYELQKWKGNLLGPGLRLMKKRIYRAAVLQRLRNNGIGHSAVQKWKGIYK